MTTSFGVLSSLLIAATLVLAAWTLVAATFVIARSRSAGPGRLPGLQPASRAPEFHAADLGGRKVTLPDPDMPTLIVFADAGCTTCRELMPDLYSFGIEQRERVSTIVVSPGPREKVEQLPGAPDAPVPIIPDAGLIAAAYRVNVSPSALLVDPNGMVLRTTSVARPDVPALLRWLRESSPA